MQWERFLYLCMEMLFKAMTWTLLAKWGEVSTVAYRICSRFTVFEQYHPSYKKAGIARNGPHS
jgi:hypothetical protein